MSYATFTDTTEIHTAVIEDGALFEHTDLDDILVHLETNAECLITMVRDVITH